MCAGCNQRVKYVGVFVKLIVAPLPVWNATKRSENAVKWDLLKHRHL